MWRNYVFVNLSISCDAHNLGEVEGRIGLGLSVHPSVRPLRFFRSWETQEPHEPHTLGS